MHKDREQRYQSAHELQRDIQRYLDNEPIHARPPSIVYQMKVFARRNRGLFVSTVVVATVLIAATAVSITLAVHATRSADEARAAEARVLKEQENLQATSGYLIHVLSIPTPSVAQGRAMTPQQQLIEAGSDIDMWFESMPERATDQHALIGYFMVKMGMYDEAEEHLIPALPKIETEFGRDHWKTQFALMTIAQLRDGQGNMEEADELSAEVETAIRNVAHVDGAWTPFGIEMMLYRLELLSSMFRWDDAVALAEELLEHLDGVGFNKATNGFSDKEMELAIKGQLGRNLLMLSTLQTEESVKSEMFEQSHDLLAEVVDTGPTIRGIGPRHPVVANAQAKLSICQWGSDLGTKRAAIDAVREIGIVYGPNHRRTLEAQLNIGNLLYQKQEFTESEATLRSTVAALQQQLRPDHILLQTANVYLGRTLARVNKVDEAEPLLRNASRNLSEQLPPDHVHRIMASGLYGMCLQSQGRFEEAAPYHDEFISALEERWGQQHDEPIQIRFISILRYFEHGRHDEALRKMRTFLSHCQSVLGEGHPIYIKFQTEHGDMLRDMGRNEQALKVFEQSYDDAMQHLTVGDSRSWARPARNSAEADLQVARASLGNLDGALAVNDQIIAYALQEDVSDGVERVVWAIGWRLTFLQETDRQGEVDQLFDQLVQQWWDDAASLNEAAWALGNDEDTSLHSERYAEQMLKISERACELTDHENPIYLDTLAFVHYGRGEVPLAIRIQEQAVELAPEDELESYQEALERYRNALPKAAE